MEVKSAHSTNRQGLIQNNEEPHATNLLMILESAVGTKDTNAARQLCDHLRAVNASTPLLQCRSIPATKNPCLPISRNRGRYKSLFYREPLSSSQECCVFLILRGSQSGKTFERQGSVRLCPGCCSE